MGGLQFAAQPLVLPVVNFDVGVVQGREFGTGALSGDQVIDVRQPGLLLWHLEDCSWW
jgi:hypothetical protein